jgi:hypothetical protein
MNSYETAPNFGIQVHLPQCGQRQQVVPVFPNAVHAAPAFLIEYP